MDVIEFLRARLDEDEAAARAAEREHTADWRVGVENDILPDEPRGNEYVACGPWEGGIEDGSAAHIARHDPARVLREVEAKRRIIANWERDVAQVATDGGYEAGAYDALACLASVYSDHPDYDEAWRP